MQLILDQWIDLGQRPCSLVVVMEISTAFANPPMDSLWAWYKADAQSFSNGAVADPIVDSGPNGYHLNTHVAGSPIEPHFFTNILNGKPVFKWTATDGSFRNVTSLNSPGFSMSLVTRRTSLNALYSGTTICEPEGSFNYTIRSFDSGASDIRFNALGIGSQVNLIVPLGTWQILTYTYDDTEGIVRFKTNLLSGSGSVGGGGVNLNRPKLQHFLDGEVAEALMYSKKQTDTEVFNTRAYLSSKYNIAIL